MMRASIPWEYSTGQWTWLSALALVTVTACGRLGFDEELRDAESTDTAFADQIDARVQDQGGPDLPRPDADSGDSTTTDLFVAMDTVDADAATIDCAGRLLCDDFEAADPWDNQTLTGDATLSRSTTQVFQGRFAAEARLSGLARALFSSNLFPEGGAVDQWVRAYVFVEIDPAARYYELIAYVGTTYDVTLESGHDSTNVHTHRRPGGEIAQQVDRPLPLGRWYCLETQLQTGGASSFSVHVDGELWFVLEDDSSDPRGFPEVQVSAIYSLGDSVAVYLDNVVVDDRRIGCL